MTDNLRDALTGLLVGRGAFALVDAAVNSCNPEVESLCNRLGISCCILPSPPSKNLESAAKVWTFLSDNGATRSSVLVNIGGGSVTDLGGFCAATFKRGIDYVNCPTTLLAAVDASLGGKTGIDFNGLKNEVGAFRIPVATIISPGLLASLPFGQILSGMGEVIKTGFIHSSEMARDALERVKALSEVPGRIVEMGDMIRRTADVKLSIVDADPLEKGLRKVLNFGHTAGHAFESLSMERSGEQGAASHGHAVAQGLLVALVISHVRLGLDSIWLDRLASTLRTHFPPIIYTCDDYPHLLSIMSHDKKNPSPDSIRFTLLESPGEPVTDFEVSSEEIRTALDITRDYLHI